MVKVGTTVMATSRAQQFHRVLEIGGRRTMDDESIDILDSNYSDEEMFIDNLFSKAFEEVETCKIKIENIERIHTA